MMTNTAFLALCAGTGRKLPNKKIQAKNTPQSKSSLRVINDFSEGYQILCEDSRNRRRLRERKKSKSETTKNRDPAFLP